MFDTFQLRAEAVGAEVVRVARFDDAVAATVELLRREEVADLPGRRALWAQGASVPDASRRAAAEAVPGLSFDVTREAAADAKVGISAMTWGLADTGSVAQDASDVALRLVSTLPIAHVALFDIRGLLPDLASLVARVTPRTMRYLSVITGPSRTADIERVLTIGVHGPQRLYLVCYDGTEG